MQWQQHQKHQPLKSVAIVKPAILQENLSNLFGLSYVFVFVWHKVFCNGDQHLVFLINNNALKKCPSGKAFYIVATASAQFFATLI